jgi:hypothetical protein
VYFFLGEDRELLYIGKATSLRSRLRQHAAASDRGLYRATRTVCWETAPDPSAAAMREADLIVALQPRYNAAIKNEASWAFVTVRRNTGMITFALCPRRDPNADNYGCFPHLGPGLTATAAIACSDGFTSFLRLWWAADAANSGAHFPARIASTTPPPAFDAADIDATDRIDADHLHAFLSGHSARLLDQLGRLVADRADPYKQPALRRDLDGAAAFFERGPARLRALRLRHRVGAGPLEKAAIVQMLRADVAASIGDGFWTTANVGGDD